MKCPFRKITITNKGNIVDKTVEEFCECYGKECPYYAEHNSYLITNDGEKSSVKIIEVCNKTITTI